MNHFPSARWVALFFFAVDSWAAAQESPKGLTTAPQVYRVIDNDNPPYVFVGKGVLTSVHFPEPVSHCENESVGYAVDWFGRTEASLREPKIVSITAKGREVVGATGAWEFIPPPETNLNCLMGSKPVTLYLKYDQTGFNVNAYLYDRAKPPPGAVTGSRDPYKAILRSNVSSVPLRNLSSPNSEPLAEATPKPTGKSQYAEAWSALYTTVGQKTGGKGK